MTWNLNYINAVVTYVLMITLIWPEEWRSREQQVAQASGDEWKGRLWHFWCSLTFISNDTSIEYRLTLDRHIDRVLTYYWALHRAASRNFFWDPFLKELRHQAQLGNQAFWWFVNNSILTSPDWLKCDWMGTGKGTFLLLAREKTNGKLSINPIFFLFSRERILPYLAALRSNTNLLPLAKIRFLREFYTLFTVKWNQREFQTLEILASE